MSDPSSTTRNSDEFLVAFSRLEKQLKRLTGGSKYDTFSQMLAKASKRNATLRRMRSDLRQYGDLRNAIVHERAGGYVIAEPHDETVENLKGMVKRLENPPRAEQVVSAEVSTCTREERIGSVAPLMFDRSFSQLPVIEEDAIVALLTTDAIARWMAACLEEDVNLVEDESVREILEYAEDADNFELVGRNTEVAQILDMFAAHEKKGPPLRAVVVTQNGARDEAPIGILTLHDLPRLYALLGE